MILKSLSRRDGTRQLLKYLTEKKERLIGDKQSPILIRHNVRSRSLDKWVKEYEHNESFRLHPRKNSVRVFHSVLSLSTLDRKHVNEKMLRDIAKQYMKLRGENNMYIGVAHYDKAHVHLHLVMSGTKYLTGESNRLSRKEFHELKIAMDTYQKRKYPELVNSLPRHGRSKELKALENDRERTPGNIRETQKETLRSLLDSTYAKSKSLDDFIVQMKEHNHPVYFRNGRLQGVQFEGDRKFRFTNLNFDKEKLEKLDMIRINEERELEHIRELREARSPERDIEQETSSRNDQRLSDAEYDKDEEEDKEEEEIEEEETDNPESDSDDSSEDTSDEIDMEDEDDIER